MKRIISMILMLLIAVSNIKALAETPVVNEFAHAEFAPSPQYNGLTVTTNAQTDNTGLKLVAAEKVTNANGDTTYNVSSTYSWAGFDISDSNGNIPSYKNTYAEIEYLDSGYGYFFMKYDSLSGVKTTESVCLYNSGEYKTFTFSLSDAKFTNGVSGGYDFVIDTMTGTYTLFYSRYPVSIKSVSLYFDNTYSSIGLNIATNNYGNVFFGNDDPEFDVTLKNRSLSRVMFNLDYNIYKCDMNMNKILYRADTKTYNLAADETKVEKITCPVDKYGLYYIEVKAYGNETRIVKNSKEVSFAKCVLNDSLNKKLGACGGTTGNMYNFNMDAYFTLMAKAGLGLHRSGLQWAHYETTKGVKALNTIMKQGLTVCGSKGIEQLIILFGNNPLYDNSGSGFIQDQYMSDYLAYVESLITEPEFRDNVSMIEVWNEPDLVRYLGTQYIFNDKQAQAAQYTKILKAQYDTIQRVNSSYGLNYKVGAGSLSGGIYINSLKSFADYFLNALNGEKSFDIFTLHPYQAAEDPEYGSKGVDTKIDNSSLAYRLQYYDALLEGKELYSPSAGTSSRVAGISTGNYYNYDMEKETWLTETGWSTAVYPPDADCIGDEYKQAVNIVREYNQIRLNDFNDKTWLYCFSDVGLRKNEQEHKFGLVNAFENSVMYAPKYSYLAVSNLNKLTGDAVAVSEVYNNDFKYVSKYSTPDENVYMLWTSKTDIQSLSFDLGEDVIYYNLFGNRLSVNEVMSNGQYILSETPFYAVNKKSNYFNITGHITSNESGKMVSVAVYDGQSVLQGNLSESCYIDQAYTDSSGAFNFKVELDYEKAPFTAYVKPEGGVPISIELAKDDENINKITSVDMNLYDSLTNVESIAIDAVDLKNAVAVINFNKINGTVPYTFCYAVYKNNMLVGFKSFNGEQNDTQLARAVYNVSLDENVEFDSIKMFLLNSLEGIVPLCQAKAYN